jgi:hypothetical protein
VNSRRLALGGLAVLASATLALAGCSASTSSGGGASASASPSPSPVAPKDAVLAAVKQLTQSSFQYTMAVAGLNGQGTADPVNKKLSVSLGGTQSGLTVKIDVVEVGADLWVRMDIGGKNSVLSIPTKWMHVDQTKLSKTSGLGVDLGAGDVTGTTGIFQGLVDVQRVDAQHYTATFDLTKAPNSRIDADTLKKLGDKATAVPGTITLDASGRLAELDIDLSSVDPNLSVKNTFSAYGAPVTINAPAASDTVEAPANVYTILNGS